MDRLPLVGERVRISEEICLPCHIGTVTATKERCELPAWWRKDIKWDVEVQLDYGVALPLGFMADEVEAMDRNARTKGLIDK